VSKEVWILKWGERAEGEGRKKKGLGHSRRDSGRNSWASIDRRGGKKIVLAKRIEQPAE